ncbi:MAG: HlyD family efflux transporter periplasmic adaptor subunit [Chitinophagaceae bacterium]|nr:HlyD family efflux transporter periplasmic adaptor subunit [Chitinophagaceae bacterium]
MKSNLLQIFSISVLLFSCKNENSNHDASGTFEATETIISAEATGKILAFDISEGDVIKQGQQVGYIDSTQLHLSKMQLTQSQKAILSGRPDVKTQIEALQNELDNAVIDKKRMENLVKGEVASQKQLDDANTRIAVLQSKIAAQKSVLHTTTTTLDEQGNTVQTQLAQVEDQLRKCRIINPVNGTVLTKYANTFEMTAAGKPLYKIADLTVIELRAYITNDQFANIKLGQKVKVNVDDGNDKLRSYDGTIDWINNKAEFTPKSIQTKDERANMVYAIKIRVQNDGLLKIGMYGEVVF